MHWNFQCIMRVQFQEVTFTVNTFTDNGWTQAAGHTDINQDGWQIFEKMKTAKRSIG
ncbi:MAG: hypothetical protein IPL46_30670 [Saprospiraceae bacterium]|nr:hypothetical protein [Saprospiraceae bacterium]